MRGGGGEVGHTVGGGDPIHVVKVANCRPPAFATRVFWNTAVPVDFVLPWRLSRYIGGAEQLQQRPCGPQSLRYLLSGPWLKKAVDPCPRGTKALQKDEWAMAGECRGGQSIPGRDGKFKA